MRSPSKKDEPTPLSVAQIEFTKATIEATAQITAAMVNVTTEKNPAKISEAYRVIYKAIAESVRSGLAAK